MKPSETPSGQLWLANFSEPDLPAATVLLDSLRFVDLQTLYNALLSKLQDLQQKGKIGTPALALPERKLKELEEGKPLNKKTAVAYVDFHPGAKVDVTSGSEGFIGGILRNFAEAGTDIPNSPWVAPDAPLEKLRERRCRSIVLVTDYCGTGSQALTLASALARNKTIKSWRSLKLITIHVLAFAASSSALERLDASPAVDAVHTVEVASTFDTAPWTEEIREAIEDLCLRESRVRTWHLGYEGSGGLLVTGRRAPNNLPAVFWQRGAGWSPLFPKRNVQPEVANELAGYQPTEPLPNLAARVGQLRIGRNERLAYMRPASRDLLKILLSIRRSRKTPAKLSAELGIPLDRMKQLLGGLVNLGFLDHQHRITAEGQREITAQKRALRRTAAGLQGSDAPYYPHSLK